MTLNRKRCSFVPEFKLKAAQLVLEQGYSITDAAVAMGIGKSTLYKWIRQLRQELVVKIWKI